MIDPAAEQAKRNIARTARAYRFGIKVGWFLLSISGVLMLLGTVVLFGLALGYGFHAGGALWSMMG